MSGARTRSRHVVLLVAVAALIACLLLFLRSYRSSNDDTGVGTRHEGAGPVSTLPSVTPGPAVTALPGSAGQAGTGRTSAAPAGQQAVAGGIDWASPMTLPAMTITPVEPGGISFIPLPTHRIVLTVTSSGPIGRLGYVIPTSKHDSYGDIKGVGAHWSLTTTVAGKPYYAALFIAAGSGGRAVTCTISIDGVVKDTQTAEGDFGRAVCAA